VTQEGGEPVPYRSEGRDWGEEVRTEDERKAEKIQKKK
jgi:hypothetical protein